MLSRLRAIGPAVAWSSSGEAVRAGAGVFIGLGITGLLALSGFFDLAPGFYLIAPFGASAVLLFAVPNSPLAQPWPAIVGNTVAALVSVTVCMYVPDPTLRIALAVGLAMVVTILCRAVHPPAGAVAMTVAMNPDAVSELGFMFAITPVATGSAILVLLATLYARLTGRRYPFRQFDEPNKHGTLDPEPTERLDLTEEELTEILERYRQSLNLGVEDLARLIGAAELQASTHRISPTTAGDVMSRNLITVRPETPVADIADLFKHHRFASLPVVIDDGHFLGVIYQINLISFVGTNNRHLNLSVAPVIKRLLGSGWDKPVHAADVMDIDIPRAEVATPIAALLHWMADGDVDAVPVLKHTRIVGIVTRSDLIRALARESLVTKDAASEL
ncbi:HPP family protein [Emcibacter sp.]|uniref:HPP family protein n=1 Tax=Emcibacter sp. TaxID=1979954 RepID=UPI002AA88A4D|nr:HPP family protein [Emcibacter sp.]